MKTTGEVISRLGVLTAASTNLLKQNHLPRAVRRQAIAEIRAIASGDAGVSPEKVQARSLERCAAGMWN